MFIVTKLEDVSRKAEKEEETTLPAHRFTEVPTVDILMTH